MKKNNFFKSLKFKTSIRPELFRIFIVIISTIIYGIGLSWFIEASSVRTYAGGIPGIAQLIADIVKLSNNGELAEGTRSIIMFIAILGLNIPIFILGWFGVSKRFTDRKSVV